jgi:hypothetical protein
VLCRGCKGTCLTSWLFWSFRRCFTSMRHRSWLLRTGQHRSAREWGHLWFHQRSCSGQKLTSDLVVDSDFSTCLHHTVLSSCQDEWTWWTTNYQWWNWLCKPGASPTAPAWLKRLWSCTFVLVTLVLYTYLYPLWHLRTFLHIP